MEIKEENLKVAYDKGCKEVKLALQDLFPDFKFKLTLKYPDGYEHYGAVLFCHNDNYILIVRKELKWRTHATSLGPDGSYGPDGYDKFWFIDMTFAMGWFKSVINEFPWIKVIDATYLKPTTK